MTRKKAVNKYVTPITYKGKPGSFADAMTTLMERLAYIQKDGKNTFHKYKFVSEAAVKAKLNPVMVDLGLFVKKVSIVLPGTPTPESCVALVTLTITDGGTNTVEWEGAGSAKDKGDKAVMKALAAAMKYAVTMGAVVSTGDDPEADAQVDEEAAKLLAEQWAQKIGQCERLPSLSDLRTELKRDKDSLGSHYTTVIALYKEQESELKNNA